LKKYRELSGAETGDFAKFVTGCRRLQEIGTGYPNASGANQMRIRHVFAASISIVIGLLTAPATGHDPEPSVSVKVLARSTESWDGTDLPDFSAQQTEVTMLKITIAPKSKMDLHKHPVVNAGYMLSGALTVHSEDGRILKIKEGDAIVEMVDRWHYGVNESDRPATILVTYFGAFGSKLSVKKD
jgi:quercetin dioxygenase-like cupin family protein